MRTVKVFAAKGTPANYGDNLMSSVLPALFDIEPVFVGMSKAELIGIGSILDCYHRKRGHLSPFQRRPWRELHAWGSGFMNRDGRHFWPQKVTVHAVRGPLSREKVGDRSLPMGDPALLLPLIWPKPATPTAAVTIIPHFKVYSDFLRDFAAGLPKHWKMIDLLGDPHEITMQIASSDIVVSSSLHGLVVADAYDVPSIWMKADERIKGDGFKFEDYEAYRGEKYPAPQWPADLLSRKLFANAPRAFHVFTEA